MKEVKLHLASLDDFFTGAADAARRIEEGDLREQTGIIAFENMEVLLKVLTSGRWQLLRMLRKEGPTSIRQLAQRLERDYRAVHSDVHALMDAGLVERNGRGEILVPWEKITAEMAFDLAA